jgi:ribose-phosphate pyrophosphokinase
MSKELKIISGSSNPPLAKDIVSHLGIELAKIKINKFKDGEIGIQIEENVRGTDLYIIQSMSTPVNDHLMELLLIVDAARRASAKSISCVIPYYGYARQDRKNKPRVPISAALVAELLEAAGANRVLACDLHCGQIQGFFRIPVDNLPGKNVLAEKVLKSIKDLSIDTTIVSPDAGGVERALEFRKTLLSLDGSFKFEVAMMNKHREEANKIATMELVGDVQDRDVILYDDMIDTAGTLTQAAQILKEKGAKRVFACATHALLNDPATQLLMDSPIELLFVTNTIGLKKEMKKIIVCSMGKTIAEAVRRVHNCESVSTLF